MRSSGLASVLSYLQTDRRAADVPSQALEQRLIEIDICNRAIERYLEASIGLPEQSTLAWCSGRDD
jgi:hypothetical protein